MSRRKKLFVPSITLDRQSSVPLHTQIHRQTATAIRSGAIHCNARLPSTRTLATLLHVSRNTVLTAYDELVSDGLLRGERGAGMCVTFGASAAPSWISLRRAVRAAGYPARIIPFADPDGNPLYILS